MPKQVKKVHEIQKVQEIFEAKEAEMSRTQIGKECMIAMAVGEKALQEGVQGDSATAAAVRGEVSLDPEETKKVQKNEKYLMQCKSPDKL